MAKKCKLKKPASIASNEFKSAKWDEITDGRDFTLADVPVITMLVQWYAIADKCIDDMDMNGETSLVYQNDMGDIKGFPQVSMLKQASAEIRQLNKQLGINDTKEAEQPKKRKEVALYVMQSNRRARANKAHNTAAG